MTNPSPSLYPGFNVLLMGPSGSGKTFSIASLAETGLEVFALFVEPGLETLIGAYSDANKPIPKNLHWHYIQPRTQGFDQLQATADNIGKFDLAGLSKLKDFKRSQANPMFDLYSILNNFKDQRTGETFGSVDSWDNSRVLVIDSLSALNRMAMETVVGTKPVKDMAEWGIAQTQIMSLLHKLTSGCNCHLVLIAHVEREIDNVLGGLKLMPSTLGKAIASQVSQPFSDVILSVREGDKFFWDTANSQADLKTRNLPIASKLPADFGTIFSKWNSRRNLAEGRNPPTSP